MLLRTLFVVMIAVASTITAENSPDEIVSESAVTDFRQKLGAATTTAENSPDTIFSESAVTDFRPQLGKQTRTRRRRHTDDDVWIGHTQGGPQGGKHLQGGAAHTGKKKEGAVSCSGTNFIACGIAEGLGAITKPLAKPLEELAREFTKLFESGIKKVRDELKNTLRAVVGPYADKVYAAPPLPHMFLTTTHATCVT